MRAAADVSRRDVIPQAWLLGHDLQSGDLPQAMSRLDLILRTQIPRFQENSFRFCSRSSAMTMLRESLRSSWKASALAIKLSHPSVSGGARPARCVGAVLSPGRVIGPSACGRAEAVSRSFDPHRPSRGGLCRLDAKPAPGTAEHPRIPV